MKKTIIGIFFFLLLSSNCEAQTIKIRGGINVSNILAEQSNSRYRTPLGGKVTEKMGFEFDIYTDIQLKKISFLGNPLEFQTGLNASYSEFTYHQKYSVNYSPFPEKARDGQNYASISYLIHSVPLLLKININPDLHILAGASIGIGTYGRFYHEREIVNNIIKVRGGPIGWNSSLIESFELAIKPISQNLIVGISQRIHIFDLSVFYRKGLTDMAEDLYPFRSVKSDAVKFLIGMDLFDF